MMRSLILALGLALGGCAASGGRGGEMPAVYDLGPPPRALPPAAGSPSLGLETRAPAWLDSPGIAYRLAYAEPGRLRTYARARWAGPPASLIEQRLAQGLGLPLAGQGRAACLLRIDLDEFAQIFTAPAESHGLLQVRVSLLERSRQPLAGMALRLEKPAPDPAARGGVEALTAAVGQLAAAVDAWREELAASGRLRACEGR